MNYKDFKEEQLKDKEFKEYWDDTEPLRKISNLLIDYRMYYDMSQEELAALTGVSLQEIKDMENLDADPSVNTLVKLFKPLRFKMKLDFKRLSKSGMLFELDFVLDEERMRKDALDPEEKWDELQEIVNDIEEVHWIERGCIASDNTKGAMSWMMDVLDHLEWFMKYVCRWESIHLHGSDDVIAVYKKMGIKCNYQ